MQFSRTMGREHNSAQRKIQLNWCAPVYSSFFLGQSQACPTPQSLQCLDWGKQPPPQPTTSLGHWGLEELGLFQKNALPRIVTRSGPTKENIGPGEEIEPGPSSGPLEDGLRKEKTEPSQAPGEYDLQSIHRHFLYKHPSPDRKQGWGN